MKKMLTAVLVVLVCSLTILSNEATLAFTDIRGSWAEATIQKWQDEGRITGFPDGTFRPESGITRAELVNMVNPLFGFTDQAEIQFSDVTPTGWYYEGIGTAVSAGYVTGYPDGTFAPSQRVTRQEMAVIMTRVLGLSSEVTALPFRDADEIPDWSWEAIASVYEHGLMSGIGDGRFRGDDVSTRAEAIVLLERAYQYWLKEAQVERTIQTSGVYGPKQGMLNWPSDLTIASADVVLQNVIVSGNLLLADSIGEGDVSLVNVQVEGETTVAGGGSNSVAVTDSTFSTVVVEREEGLVRIAVQGTSTIERFVARSAALLELSGESSVEHLMAAAPLNVRGAGEIYTATITTEGDVSFEREPQHVTVDIPESVDPADPPGEAPSQPEKPQPTTPTEPDEPVAPEDRDEPSRPDPPRDPVEPTLPSDPPEPSDPVDPVEPVDPVKPLKLVSASATIGGQTVAARVEGNVGRVNASSFAGSESISGFSIQASENVDQVQVTAFGIRQTLTLTNGSGSISVQDVLGSLLPADREVTLSHVRRLVGESTTISGTLIGSGGEREHFQIHINL